MPFSMLTIFDLTYRYPRIGDIINEQIAKFFAQTAQFLFAISIYINIIYEMRNCQIFLQLIQKQSYLLVTNIIISRMFKKIVIGLIGLGAVSPLHQCEHIQTPQNKRHAISILYPHNSNVRGVVSFSQDSILGPTKVCCSVKGLNPNSKHGIHVHQFGDLTDGCTTAGPHYNPHGKSHGGPFQGQRHVGDLGNLITDPFGNSFMCFVDKQISLYGQYSIIGRSVVVHGGQDDLGKGGNQQSLKTGNSGARVACGVIGLSKQFKGLNPNQPTTQTK